MINDMLRVGVIGATGYTGEELIKILLKHSYVKINYLSAKIERPKNISEIFPYLKGRLDLLCDNLKINEAMRLCDLLFLALPHTVSMQITPELLKNKKYVIDLSADYRLKNKKLYELWYKIKHKDSENLKRAIYGLPEIYEDEIKGANLIANPGCYPTAAILAIAPLLKYLSADRPRPLYTSCRGRQDKIFKIQSIYIDAKSGYSGAGRKDLNDPFYREIENNFKAYNINSHRHIPEIFEQLSIMAKKNLNIVFVPHILPIERGILETIYVNLSYKLQVTSYKLIKIYREFYKDKPFIRIKEEDQFPQIKDTIFTNFCDMGIKVSQDKKTVIIISCIDNLLKGASGQVVQNMNIIFGFKQTEALL